MVPCGATQFVTPCPSCLRNLGSNFVFHNTVINLAVEQLAVVAVSEPGCRQTCYTFTANLAIGSDKATLHKNAKPVAISVTRISKSVLPCGVDVCCQKDQQRKEPGSVRSSLDKRRLDTTSILPERPGFEANRETIVTRDLKLRVGRWI